MAKDYPQRVRELRHQLGLTQFTMAELLRVRPQVVASWEQGRKEPSASSYQQLARLAPASEAWFFLEQIGITRELVRSKWATSSGSSEPGNASESTAPLVEGVSPVMVQIPILREKAAGRHPRELSPDDIESFMAMPLGAAPRGAGSYTGIIVRGDAMKPTLCDRFIAVIDHANRDAARLVGRVVALLLDGAVVVRRLIGQNSSGDLLLRADGGVDPDMTLRPASSNPILGDVVFWWGTQGPAESARN